MAGETGPDPLWSVTDARHDFAVRLIAYAPDGPQLGVMPEPIDLKVTYPLSDVPALQFQYRKDAPGADWLLRPDGLEVATELYIPRVGRWVEPINGRYVVLDWEDDVVDPTNIMKITAPGYAWLMSKVLVHKGKHDDKLRAAEDKAIEEKDKARREYQSANTSFNSAVTSARSEFKCRGYQFVTSWFPRRKGPGKPLTSRNLLFHTGRRKFYWWSTTHRRWYMAKASSNVHSRASQAYNDRRTKHATYLAAVKRLGARSRAAKEVSRNHKRPMLNATAGHVMGKLINEARARQRGRLAGMGTWFNGTYASGFYSTGVPGAPAPTGRRKWSSRFNIELSIGSSLLDVLQQLTEMGECEWFFYKRTLRMYRPGDLGVKLTSQVALLPGTDMTEAPDRASRREFANYIHVRGEEHTSFGMWNNAKTQATGWGVWEKAVAISGVTKTAELKKAALKEARQALNRIKVESTRGLSLGGYGSYRPMYDYLPGQYIMAYGSNGIFQQYRVMSITLEFSEDGSVTGNAVLGDKFMQRALDFRNSMARTVGGYEKVIGGGTVPLLPSPPADTADEEDEASMPVPVLAASVRAGVNNLTGAPATILNLAWQTSEEPNEEEVDPLPPADEPDDEEGPDDLD